MIRVIKERGYIHGRTITLQNIPKLRDNELVEVLICFPDGLDRDDEDCIEAVYSPKSEDVSHATILRTLFGVFNRFSLTPLFSSKADPLGNV